MGNQQPSSKVMKFISSTMSAVQRVNGSGFAKASLRCTLVPRKLDYIIFDLFKKIDI